MIVSGIGLTSEQVLPRSTVARKARAVTSEWLVITADERLRSHLAAAIDRHDGVIRDGDRFDERCRLGTAVRRCAFVDLVASHGGSAAGFLAEVARSTLMPRPLLIVRGADGDDTGEILARRAGAIAYLSGSVRMAFLDALIGEICP